ncbi:MAG: membrane protein insertase YidC [Gammaproteobacteria bacterium]|nr:membrane protein insertase YidC [Gammaproteobacteria bacterium]
MDFQRTILFLALAFTLLLLWQAWQADYGPQPTPAPTVQAPAQDLPVPAAPDSGAAAGAPMRPGLDSVQRVRVVTDVFNAVIDAKGGDLRHVDLLGYPVSVDDPDNPVTLLSDERELFVAQSGLLPADRAPSHHATYVPEAAEYRLAAGQDALEVPLHWTSPEGITVTKTYTFHRGSYAVDVTHRVANSASAEWRGNVYYQWLRSPPVDNGRAFIYTYTGGVISGQEAKYEKIDFDDMEDKDLARDLTGGWAAMIQHYFLGAWIPPQDASYRYYSNALGDSRYILGLISPALTVAPGDTGEFPARLYVGPKAQETLAQVAPNLELTVDYGMLTVIAKPLYWLLEKIHSFVGNWGWAIIILTILIKLAFYKLSETSYKSMAHMRKVQPRLVALKERFGDDRQKLNEAMMKMYREEKINPLGGCLPILVQIPVFIALYWVLLESVELRQAPGILWIQDLSIADPFFILPILMGVTMLVQHRLNPTPMDPVQAKVMLALPIIFTVFFAFFPAGLVLYWVVNNTLSILQQWYITRWVVKA